jgi:putative Mg2+ transporter-C (MgtC) family protein
MHSLTIAEFAVRVGVGLGCGALIGLERQWRARMAGLRTNALVAAGATLFVLYSVAAGDLTSPTRVASYVVSGVGFLGGGVIVRDGFNVRGLNTAATLWSSAAVGVLAGGGMLLFALVGTAAIVATHLFGRPLGRFIDHDHTADPDEELQPHRLYLTCSPKMEQQLRAQIVAHSSGRDLVLRGVRTEPLGDHVALTAYLLVDRDGPSQLERLVAQLSQQRGIHAVQWLAGDEPEPDVATKLSSGSAAGAASKSRLRTP